MHEAYKESGHYNECVEKIIYDHAGFVPALIEKCRVNLNCEDFNQLEEGFEELLHTDKKNLLGLIYKTFFYLLIKGDLENASRNLDQLYSTLNETEPNNYNLYHISAKVIFSFIKSCLVKIVEEPQ